jgi:ribonuclease HII
MKAVDRFEFEAALAQRGIVCIAGVDEAGRGPLAGSVFAAAVVFPLNWILKGIPDSLKGLNDSKQLTARMREQFYSVLTSHPEISWAVAECDSEEVDRINILQATHEAMQRAIGRLKTSPEWLLIDGLPVTRLGARQTAIVKGDSRSYSIAAASIIAKVSRDRQMLEWDRKYPHYGFAGHKGYATAAHLAALAEFGPCPIHRRSFAPLKPADPDLFG